MSYGYGEKGIHVGRAGCFDSQFAPGSERDGCHAAGCHDSRRAAGDRQEAVTTCLRPQSPAGSPPGSTGRSCRLDTPPAVDPIPRVSPCESSSTPALLPCGGRLARPCPAALTIEHAEGGIVLDDAVGRQEGSHYAVDGSSEFRTGTTKAVDTCTVRCSFKELRGGRVEAELGLDDEGGRQREGEAGDAGGRKKLRTRVLLIVHDCGLRRPAGKGLDVLANCAGIMRFGRLEELDPAALRRRCWRTAPRWLPSGRAGGWRCLRGL
jgi:hypothetical protein